MSNLYSNIIREIVAKHFKVRIDLVILPGKINPGWIGKSFGSPIPGESYSDAVYAFDGSQWFDNFECVDGTVGTEGGGTMPIASLGNLSQILSLECPNAIIIAIWKWSDSQKHENPIFVYKAPDWKSYLGIPEK